MERVIGGVLGLIAFAATAVASLSRGAGLSTAVWRSCVALLLGYWIGRLVFGSLGMSTVKEVVGSVPPPAPTAAPGEGKPAAAPPPGSPSKTQ